MAPFRIPAWLHWTLLVVAPSLVALTHYISNGSIPADATVGLVCMTTLGLIHSVDPTIPTDKKVTSVPPPPTAA